MRHSHRKHGIREYIIRCSLLIRHTRLFLCSFCRVYAISKITIVRIQEKLRGRTETAEEAIHAGN